MDSRTDLELMTAIQEYADRSAFGELYDRYGGKVYALAHGIVHSKPDAEDVTQEVFEIVWKKSHTFQNALGEVKYWVLRIGHNRAINRLKARACRSSESSSDSHTEEAETFLEPAMDFDLCEYVHTALRHLPPDQERLIELAFFQGLSHAEIAETERLPLGTVKTRIRSGITRLRSELRFLKSPEITSK